MRAVHGLKPGSPLELVERPMPEPGPGKVRVKLEACGICHSDSFTVEGHYPGIHYPRVPGHEIAGHVDALGPGVTAWRVGQRVGVGWHGGHCCVGHAPKPWRNAAPSPRRVGGSMMAADRLGT
jgi:D-arabinose 1-dehydrogenase-like Zn-dependent alcohol dehydrogenase